MIALDPGWLLDRDNLGSVADALGLVGAVIGLITLLRVSSVRNAQEDERRILRELYGLDTLSTLLTAATDHIGNGAQASQKEAKDLANRLSQMLGRVDGINRALAIAAPELTPGSGDVRIVPGDYFSDAFIKNGTVSAKKKIDILVYRNQQVSNAFVLDDLIAAAQRGIRVRILAMSSLSDDATLNASMDILPRPTPSNVNLLRRQLQLNEQTIDDHLAQQGQALVEYCGYRCAPLVHMMVVDDDVRLGVVGTVAAAQPASLSDRPYFVLSATSPPGEILRKHFEQLYVSADALADLTASAGT